VFLLFFHLKHRFLNLRNQNKGFSSCYHKNLYFSLYTCCVFSLTHTQNFSGIDFMKKTNNTDTRPLVGNDPLDRLINRGRYYNHYSAYLNDFQLAGEQELLMHYFYGAAGPFIDLLTYVDLGVGWSLQPVGFKDDKSGLEAKELVESEFYERDFYTTMIQFATYYLVLGRACLVKTHNQNGEFYKNAFEGVTGIDCINPLTLDIGSIRDVVGDPTGTKPFKQSDAVFFSQDRVIYRTNNNLTRHSVMGFSPLQSCMGDLRLINQFPVFRERLARKYANLYRMIKIDPEKLRSSGGSAGEAIFENRDTMQRYLDETAGYFNVQEREGGAVAVFDWLEVSESSYSGDEAKLKDIEVQTLRNIAFKLDVPLDLLMYVQVVNRSVMEVLSQVFVGKRENGPRKHVYTPVIQSIANELLLQHDIHDGYFSVEFNPFLRENFLEAARILSSVWPTGAVTRPEIRNKLGLPTKPDMGGSEWEDLDPLPPKNGERS
jgi:hypothetical protein